MNNKSNNQIIKPEPAIFKIKLSMEWVVLGGVIVYLVAMPRQTGGHIPPLGGGSTVMNVDDKKKQRTYRIDTMQETLDKGLNIESYRNSVYVNAGARTNYWDVSRRESEKKIHNFADLINDYVVQVDKKQELVGHVWKKGRISMGYPAGRAPPLPWMITPFIPKPVGNPFFTNTASMFKI